MGPDVIVDKKLSCGSRGSAVRVHTFVIVSRRICLEHNGVVGNGVLKVFFFVVNICVNFSRMWDSIHCPRWSNGKLFTLYSCMYSKATGFQWVVLFDKGMLWFLKTHVFKL